MSRIYHTFCKYTACHRLWENIGLLAVMTNEYAWEPSKRDIHGTQFPRHTLCSGCIVCIVNMESQIAQNKNFVRNHNAQEESKNESMQLAFSMYGPLSSTILTKQVRVSTRRTELFTLPTLKRWYIQYRPEWVEFRVICLPWTSKYGFATKYQIVISVITLHFKIRTFTYTNCGPSY